jgi:hypothetical protein
MQGGLGVFELTGVCLNRSSEQGQPSGCFKELPAPHWPSLALEQRPDLAQANIDPTSQFVGWCGGVETLQPGDGGHQFVWIGQVFVIDLQPAQLGSVTLEAQLRRSRLEDLSEFAQVERLWSLTSFPSANRYDGDADTVR